MNFVPSSGFDGEKSGRMVSSTKLSTHWFLLTLWFQAMQPIVNIRFACSLVEARVKNIFWFHSAQFQLVFYDR